jgi:hypothetical protein
MAISELAILKYNASMIEKTKTQYVTRDYCGACWGHTCCCACYKWNNAKKSCRYCKYCAIKRYEAHYICFDCRRSYKPNRCINPEYDFYTSLPYEKKCSCGKSCIWMSMCTRVPKKTDDNGWSILKFITFDVMNDFKNADANTLASLWYHGGGIGATLHYPNSVKKQFYVPHKMNEINEWKNYFMSTKIVY